MRSQCTEFCRQSDGEWKQWSAGCLGFVLCFSVVLITIQRETRFEDGVIFPFCLFFFFPPFSHYGISYFGLL